MGKLEQYAERLKAKKKKARELIKSIESSGNVYVPQGFKEVAFSDTPDRITKKTLDTLSKVALNARYIKSSAKMVTNELYYPFPLPNSGQTAFTPSKPVTLSVHGTEAQMTRQLNKRLKNVYPTSTLSAQLKLAISKLDKDVDYEVKKVEDATRTVDWVKGVKFLKPLTYNQIQELMSIANMDKMTEKEFLENAEHRRYLSNITNQRRNSDNTYSPSPLSNLSQQTIDKLENLMNSSSAWKKAGAGRGLDSDQVQENWTKMYKALADRDDNDDDESFDLLANAIENNDTWIDYKTITTDDDGNEKVNYHHVSIYKYVENIIGEAMTPISKMKKKRKKARK